MNNTNFFNTLIQVYGKDKNKFWDVIYAPFLSNQFSIKLVANRLKLGIDLMPVYLNYNKLVKYYLTDFSKPKGINVKSWKSNRKSYINDAFPIFVFLAVWMDEMGLDKLTSKYDEILKAGILAVTGYGILDENVDSEQSSPVEILTAQALINEYEKIALDVFGTTQEHMNILHKMRSYYYDAEIKEKSCRYIKSPYKNDKPEECGIKGANALTPFMLCLSHLDKEHLIDKYLQIFINFGAAIQIIDDWKDLEIDLKVGHYSYVALGYEKYWKSKDLKKIINQMKVDKNHIAKTYFAGKNLIDKSMQIVEEINDPILTKMIEITSLKFSSFFKSELNYL